MSRCAVLLVALVLALPGTALAQGAGDNQYQDPFAGQDQGSSGSGSRGSGSGSGSSGSSSGSGSSSSGNSQLSGSPPGMSSASGTGRTLPATGGQPVPLALLGSGFLLAGVGLRLRLRRPVG